jgi:hypothetical protein
LWINRISIFAALKTQVMDSVWYFIADFFQGIFKIMNWMSPWFNKLLIVIGFIAFFIWVSYMTKQKEVEKFD